MPSAHRHAACSPSASALTASTGCSPGAILQIARRCKELNERNGAVVTLKLGQVRQRLATMRGSTAAPVYGRQGLPYEGVARRELAQA